MEPLTAKQIATALGVGRSAAGKRLAGVKHHTKCRRGKPTKLYAPLDLPEYILKKVILLRARETKAQLVQNRDRAIEQGERAADEAQPLPHEYYEAQSRIFERKPRKTRDDAYKKASIVDTYYRLRNGSELPDYKIAQQVASEIGRFSAASVWNWAQQVKGHPQQHWPYVLCSKAVGGQKKAICSVGAWDMLLGDYLRIECPTFSSCYNRVVRAAPQQGWLVPSEDTLLRRLHREVPPEVITLARQGQEALDRLRPSMARDHSVFHAMEAVNADGFDFAIYAIFEDGEICHPCMVHWQDIYSGASVGHRIGKTEDTRLYQLSYGDMLETYGISTHVWLDNTRAAANKTMTGGVANRFRFVRQHEEMLGNIPASGGIPHWTWPGHGQSKPIERKNRDFRDVIEKHPAFAGAYAKAGAIPIAKLREIVASEIAADNAKEGRRSPVCAGRSFDAVFEESYKANAEKIKRPTAELIRWVKLASKQVYAAKDSGTITLFDNRYSSLTLARHASRSLMAKYDPEKLHGSIFVYHLDGTFICEAECVAKAGFNDQQAGKAEMHLKMKFRKITRQKLEMTKRLEASDAAKYTPLVTGTTAPESAVVCGTFGNTAHKRTTPASDIGHQGATPEMEANFSAAMEQMRKERENGL